MFKWIGFVCLCLIAVPGAAQSFNLPGATAEDPAALARSMPELARKVMAVYWEDDRRRYLDNLFRLQIVAGQYADAGKSRRRCASCRREAFLSKPGPPRPGPPRFCTLRSPRPGPGRARTDLRSIRRFSARSARLSAGWTTGPRRW